MAELIEALAPILKAYPFLVVPLLGAAMLGALAMGIVHVVRLAAAQPKESASTAQLRAMAAKEDAEAARYRAEAASIAAKSSHDETERLEHSIDRLVKENDRLERENKRLEVGREKLLESLSGCRAECAAMEKRAKVVEVSMADLEERCRLMAEFIEREGYPLSQILGGRVS